MSKAESKRLPTNEDDQREIATEGNKTPDSGRVSPGVASGPENRGKVMEPAEPAGNAGSSTANSGGKSKYDPPPGPPTGKYDSKLANSFDVGRAAVPDSQQGQVADPNASVPGKRDDGGESLLGGAPREAQGDR